MPKISEAKRAQRRDQILDAALQCFSERGFQATSMADIIAASGLSAGAIYLYFRGKWDIARAVAHRVAYGSLGAAAAADRAGALLSPAEMIRAIGQRQERDGVPASLPVQIWGEAATDPEFRKIPAEVFVTLSGEFQELLAGWFSARGEAADDARRRAEEVMPIMLALVQGYLLQRALLPEFDEEAFLAAVERMIVA